MLQKGHSQKDQKLVFKTNYCLMEVKCIAEHSAILSTFIKLPFALRSLFCLFLSGRFVHEVLLYYIDLNEMPHSASFYLGLELPSKFLFLVFKG